MFSIFSAFAIYLITTGLFSLLFTMMAFISAIYRVQAAGLNPMQLVLLGTALEAAAFLFEVPTGVVADLRSRRLSVIIGYTLIGAGFILEGALTAFATILLAQIIWGIGYTFISGAQDAWLADEIGEAQLPQAYLWGSQVARAGTLFGIVASVLLGRISLAFPLLAAGCGLLALALFLVLFMPEKGFSPATRTDRSLWQNFEGTLQQGMGVVRHRPLLILVLGVSAFWGLSSEGLDRLWEAHLLENFTFPAFLGLGTLGWFGGIAVGSLVLGFIVTELVRRTAPVDRPDVLLHLQLWMNLLVVAGVILFGLATGFATAVIAVMAVQLFRGAIQPLYQAWANRQIEPRVRATVLSMNGQVNALGQVVGGPLIGMIGTAFSLRAAMTGVGLLLSPVLLLYILALRLTPGGRPVTVGR